MISKSHPDNFSSLSLKSSIIKAVTQTQFENCVTAFIALDFKLRREKLSGCDFEIISLFEGYLLMTVTQMGLEPHQKFFFEKISKTKATNPILNFLLCWQEILVWCNYVLIFFEKLSFIQI